MATGAADFLEKPLTFHQQGRVVCEFLYIQMT
jgi:hypothetical protein